jgi:hypothetical protein
MPWRSRYGRWLDQLSHTEWTRFGNVPFSSRTRGQDGDAADSGKSHRATNPAGFGKGKCRTPFFHALRTYSNLDRIGHPDGSAAQKRSLIARSCGLTSRSVASDGTRGRNAVVNPCHVSIARGQPGSGKVFTAPGSPPGYATGKRLPATLRFRTASRMGTSVHRAPDRVKNCQTLSRIVMDRSPASLEWRTYHERRVTIRSSNCSTVAMAVGGPPHTRRSSLWIAP